jgi:hypothetical protein
MTRLLVALTLLAYHTIHSQERNPSGRDIALRYAIASGFEIPREGLVVAIESDFNVPHKPEVRPSISVQASEALTVARTLGPTVTIAPADQVLRCRLHICIVAGQASVLLVMEPESVPNGRRLVHLKLYSPAPPASIADGVLRSMIVELKQENSQWVGARVVTGPKVIGLKIPPS